MNSMGLRTRPFLRPQTCLHPCRKPCDVSGRHPTPGQIAPGETRMANATISEFPVSESLPAKQVYLMAAICLVLGLGIGYLSRGLQGSASRAIAVAPASTLRSAARRVPTLDGMKQM